MLRPFLIPPFYAGSHWSPEQDDGGRPLAADGAPWCSGTGGSSPLFSDWDYLDVPGGQYRIWWPQGNTADAAQAAHMSHLIATVILPALTALMGRGPKSDGDGLCNGDSPSTDIALVDARTATVNGNGFVCGDGVSTRHGLAAHQPAAWAGSDPYLAHEIMHTIQFAFPQDGWCGDYEWLREMTAQWVQDYVTDPAYGIGLTPDDTEFEAAPHFLDAPNTSLDDDDPIRHAYGAYLLAQWRAKSLGTAWIRDIWDNVHDKDATHAVDKALQGKGFEEFWDDFALSNWNQGPVAHYQQWDGMAKHAKTVGPERIPPAMPRNPTIEVNHLAALYLELDIDSKVDELEILNDKAGDTHAKFPGGRGVHRRHVQGRRPRPAQELSVHQRRPQEGHARRADLQQRGHGGRDDLRPHADRQDRLRVSERDRRPAASCCRHRPCARRRVPGHRQHHVHVDP